MLIRLLQRLRKALLLAQTRRELHALSERRLRDLGLTRDQIDALYR
jgi:uncharacterized protein YjiS (DUF1127 family)